MKKQRKRNSLYSARLNGKHRSQISQTPAGLPICLKVGSGLSTCNESTWTKIQADSCFTQATSTSNKYPSQ